MVLKLSTEHLQAICAHAASTYPEECCGLLLGKLTQDSKILVEVIATQNIWSTEAAQISAIEAIEPTTKRSYYEIPPEDMLKVQKQARARGLNIIGIYHSHPDHPAIPSEFDRVYAWQQYSYIIVSVQQGKADTLHSWLLDDDHQFQLEEIVTIKLS